MGDFNLPYIQWTVERVPDGYVRPTDSMILDIFTLAGLTQWVIEGIFLQSNSILNLFLTTDGQGEQGRSVGSIAKLFTLSSCCGICVLLAGNQARIY